MAAVCKRLVNKNCFSRWPTIPKYLFSTDPSKQTEPADDLDKPIQYSSSKAADWKAEYSFRGGEKEDVTPWYQPLVVSLSMGAVLLYFGVLREESDIDHGLATPLYNRVDGLEEVQLTNAINYYKEHQPNYDISKIEKRLAEIRAEKT